MADKIQLRRDTASNWSTQNPVLSQGELGAETDTLKIKMGDSTSTWNQLSYLIDTGNYATSAELTAAVSNLVDAAPGALDTLNELAAALGDDANFATTVTDAIALKATASTLSTVATTGAYADVTGTPTLSTVATTGAYADVTGTPALAAVATSGNYSSLTGRPSIPGVLTDLSITDGTVGQVLTTDGSGGFTFDDTSGGGSFEATASGTLANGDKVIVNADGTVSAIGASLGYNYATVAVSGTAGSYTSAFNNQFGKLIATSDSYSAFGVTGGTDWDKLYLHDNATGNLIRTYTNPDANEGWGYSSYLGSGGLALTETHIAAIYQEVRVRVFNTSSTAVLHTIEDAHVKRIALNDTYLAVAGYQGNAGASYSGYVKIYNLSTGNLVTTLTSPGGAIASEEYGMTLAMNNDYLVVGTGRGITHVIRTSDWGLVTSIGSFSSTAGRRFLIGISDSHFAVADGNQVKVYSVSTGSLFRTISAPADAADDFGRAIQIVGNIIIISDPAAGTGFGQSSYTGKVYFFEIDSGNQIAALTVGSQDSFGGGLGASSSGVVFIGAPAESTNGGASGKMYRYQAPSLGTRTVTAENFVGITDGAYASGATATIQTAGAVDDAQSGLTAGQAYFVQADGTITTTPATPRVFAGVALSATELMIGKDMSSAAVVTYTDSDVATYLAGNGYDSASTIISTITDSAPATLDTLNELAAALGDDANFASTVTSSLALKANTSSLSTVATTGAYSDLTGTPAAVVPGGSFDAVASGTLANGDKVVVNADGTVSVVSPTGGPVIGTDPAGFGTQVVAVSEDNNQDKSYAVFDSNTNKVVVLYNASVGGVNGARVIVGAVSGKSISFGSPVAIVGAVMSYGDITFDSNANKVVVVMANFSNSGRGEAYVGTVSGTSISFGSAVVFENTISTSWQAATFDSNTNKVVVAYNTSSVGLGGRAIVGTVSGNSISFGSSVALSEQGPSYIRATFDSNSNKVVLVYREDYPSDDGVALVGTVSGDSISFGSPTSFVNLLQYYPGVAIDSNSKMVVAYRDNANSNYGTAKVGTISGTSISFGSAVVFESVNAPYKTEAIFDSSANKFLIAYTDYTNTPVGKIIAGTVSGTSISFASPVVFDSPGGRLNTTTMTFDSASNKSVLVFGTSNNNHESVVYQAEDQDIRGPNLTSENFVGISDGSYASGATATIQTAGSVDDAQSGLTAGQAYFLQEDGTIATTPDTPRVFAGVALSTTELMIGRDLPAAAVAGYTDSDVATYLTGNDYATQTATIAAITDSAPATLDTLNELAAALGDDANFASTVTASLGNKADTSSLSTVATSGAYADVTGTPTLATVATSGAYSDVTGTPSLATVATSGAYSDLTGTPAAVVPGGSFDAVASGGIADGDLVVINTDGSISVAGMITDPSDFDILNSTIPEQGGYNNPSSIRIAIPGTTKVIVAQDGVGSLTHSAVLDVNASNGNITLASNIVTNTDAGDGNSANAVYTGGGYSFAGYWDTTANKAVLVYMKQDPTNSHKFSYYATVGTYSGSTLSWTSAGKILTDNSYQQWRDFAYDSTLNRMLILKDEFGGNGNAGYSSALVSLSGSTVSMSTFTDFMADSGEPEGFATNGAITFVEGASKYVLTYTSQLNFNKRGTYARVIEANGTTKSARATIYSDTSGFPEFGHTQVIGLPGTSKFVTVHQVDGNNKGTQTYTIATVSGTSITVGNSVHNVTGWSSALSSSSRDHRIFAADNGDISVMYQNQTGSSSDRILYARDLSVTGNSISIGAAYTISTWTGYGNTGVKLDDLGSVGNRMIASWNPMGVDARFVGVAHGLTYSNLTTENYVGISDASYSDGATATIQTAGSKDDAQSSLTAGQAYFVQGDGTLDTTPATPRVFAGVALSATELMIGRDMSSASVVTYTDSDVATYLSGNGYDTATNIVATITDSAPGTLDTLNELAAALGDDANFASTVTSSLTLKANTSSLATVATSGAYADVTGTPTLSTVATSGAYSDLTGTPAAVAPSGSFDAVASGSLSNGDKVVVNTDGTVSVVSNTNTIPASVGTITQVSAAAAQYQRPAAAYDSNSNKVVVVWPENNSGTRTGKLVVGTVSGTSISFGSVTTFPYRIDGYRIAFDTNSNKIVMTYGAVDSSNYATVVIGTVSGSSVSFGTPVVFNSSSHNDTAITSDTNSNKVIIATKQTSGTKGVKVFVGTISGTSISFGSATTAKLTPTGSTSGTALTFDSNSNKVVLTYTLSNESTPGLKAMVGTVSGNSISFGSESLVESNPSWNTSIVFDSTSNKVIYAYNNQTTDSGQVRVGTVSGTNISFGSAVTFDTSIDTTSMRYDSVSNKTHLAYNVGGNVGKLITGTVSGTSISFGSPILFATGGGANTVYELNALLDTVSNNVVVIYRKFDKPAGVVVQPASLAPPNLTSENFVGIADGAYSNGATATIQTAGAVDDAQSGLTAGQAYFVQADGTIATTADSTRVFAGVAVSATELMIGRDLPADLPTGIVTADGNGDVTVAGEFIATSYNETYVALSGTTPTVDCEAGNLFSLTTSGATTFTFSNPPATGTAYGMSVKLVAGGNHAITWPASVDWASATAPEAPASGETDMLSFITHDGGTTWYGFLAGDALA